MRADAREILGFFGDRLTPRIDDPAHSLSYANRRRVEIARALALRPTLLLLDEPTAGMNQTETVEMQALIADLKQRGLTMLLIEHKLDLVMQLSDRVIVMDDGIKIAEGSPQQVRRDPAVIEAYLGHSRRSARRSRPPLREATLMQGPPYSSRAPRCCALESINTFYGAIQAHFDLSLQVPRGEIVCLLGGNASGKSTTMKIILGLVQPNSGTVSFDGETISGLRTPNIIRRGIGSVPEARRLFGAMTVRENLLMGAYRALQERPQRHRRGS